jgi:CRISPR-associated endonuclease/helicase Cas3
MIRASMPDVILAKATQGRRTLGLLEHTRAVLVACERMFGRVESPTPLTERWLRFFRLDPVRDAESVLRNVRLACLLHDIGKASDGFQRAVRRRGSQIVRHEHLSGLLLRAGGFEDWLARRKEVDSLIVMGAVAGHHLKAGYGDFGHCLDDGDSPVTMYLDSPEVRGVLALVAEELRSERFDVTKWPSSWNRREIQSGADAFRGGPGKRLKDASRADTRLRQVALATRAALMACDAAASALMREGIETGAWLDGCFRDDPLTAQWLEDNVLKPRMDEIERRTGQAFRWMDFQEEAGRLGHRALLVSPCGSGKTLAAWRWVQSQLAARQASRVLFLYPTRATATEGFRDYVSWAGGEAGALMHSTSEYDLEGMFANPGDPRRGGDYHVAERLHALGYWPKRAFSATVDSFLAFMHNQYASTCMLPVLCDSIVVIDEIHSFDRSMFAALEGFLQTFDVPVLCMTASLPKDRLAVLKERCGMKIWPDDKKQFADLERQSALPRYTIQECADKSVTLERVRAAIADRRKVLWVSNTVDRCQECAHEVSRLHPGVQVICYHSRFRLMDRKSRHEEAVRLFRDTQGPIALVTTQVCEMSLDIDADVLVTEVAPVPSLVQRMGRCCREAQPRDGRRGLVIVYPAPGDRPYDSEEMREGRKFAAEIAQAGAARSQAYLAECLDRMNIASPFASGGHVGFLDDIMFPSSRDESFREGEDYAVDAILDADVDEYLRMRRKGDPGAAGFVLPVPRRLAGEDARLGWLRSAPWSHYGEATGFHQEEVRHG